MSILGPDLDSNLEVAIKEDAGKSAASILRFLNYKIDSGQLEAYDHRGEARRTKISPPPLHIVGNHRFILIEPETNSRYSFDTTSRGGGIRKGIPQPGYDQTIISKLRDSQSVESQLDIVYNHYYNSNRSNNPNTLMPTTDRVHKSLTLNGESDTLLMELLDYIRN